MLLQTEAQGQKYRRQVYATAVRNTNLNKVFSKSSVYAENVMRLSKFPITNAFQITYKNTLKQICKT